MTMNNQTMHTTPRQGLTAAPGLFSPSSARPGQAVSAAAVPGLYAIRCAPPARCASLCAPWRAFTLSVGSYTTQGIKTSYGANLTACGIGQKESPGRLSTCPGLYGLSEFQAGFLALPVGHKGGYIVRGLHGDIVQGQPVRGHVVALTIPGEKFATFHA